MSDRLNQLKSFLETSPGDSFILFAIAKEYEKLQDDQLALEHYLKLRKQDPNYVGLYYHLGKLHERAERSESATEAYEAGMLIAKAKGDQHAFSELSSAKLNLEYE